MRATWTLLLGVGLALAGCGSEGGDARSCNDVCDKLQSCKLPSSGFRCDPSCTDPGDVCAECILEQNCADLLEGHCDAKCLPISIPPPIPPPVPFPRD